MTTAKLTSALLFCPLRFEIETGDYLDFFFSADAVYDLTLQKAEWEVLAIATIFE